MSTMSRKSASIECYGNNHKHLMSIYGGRIVFSVTSTMGETPGVVQAKVYGATSSEAGKVINDTKMVGILAGEDGSDWTIGYGEVVSARVRSDNDGDFLEVIAVDGDAFLTTPIFKSFSPGLTLRNLLDEIIANSELGVGFISQRADKIMLPRGSVVSGSPATLIRNISKQINSSFYIHHGLVYLVCPDEMSGDILSISDDDVLADPVFDGHFVNIVCDINSSIRVGRVVSFRDDVSGDVVARVTGVTAEGDTRGEMWRMSVEGTIQKDKGFSQEAKTKSVWR